MAPGVGWLVPITAIIADTVIAVSCSLLPGGAVGRELALARQVDRLAQDSRQLLGRVEPHGVFCGDEVESPLGLAMERLRRLELGLRRPGLLSRHQGIQ